MRVCEWIVKKKNVAVFFGCVGKDEHAKILEERARQDGVNVRYQKKEDHRSGKCAVLITGKHRSLIADLGAANHFTEDHLTESENQKILQGANFYYISGFFLTVSPPSIMTVAKVALERSKPFIMNLSAPFISQFFKDPLNAVLPYVDILFGNESEAVTFSKEQNFGTENLKEIGQKMVELPKLSSKKRVVIITQGHDPVLLFDNDTIREFPVKELKESDIVDTNGAGDAFVGGFLAQFIQGKPYEDCIKCGICAAKVSKTKLKASDGVTKFIPFRLSFKETDAPLEEIFHRNLPKKQKQTLSSNMNFYTGNKEEKSATNLVFYTSRVIYMCRALLALHFSTRLREHVA